MYLKKESLFCQDNDLLFKNFVMISIMRKEKLIILSISSERERIVIAFAKKFLGVTIPA